MNRNCGAGEGVRGAAYAFSPRGAADKPCPYETAAMTWQDISLLIADQQILVFDVSGQQLLDMSHPKEGIDWAVLPDPSSDAIAPGAHFRVAGPPISSGISAASHLRFSPRGVIDAPEVLDAAAREVWQVKKWRRDNPTAQNGANRGRPPTDSAVASVPAGVLHCSINTLYILAHGVPLSRQRSYRLTGCGRRGYRRPLDRAHGTSGEDRRQETGVRSQKSEVRIWVMLRNEGSGTKPGRTRATNVVRRCSRQSPRCRYSTVRRLGLRGTYRVGNKGDLINKIARY